MKSNMSRVAIIAIEMVIFGSIHVMAGNSEKKETKGRHSSVELLSKNIPMHILGQHPMPVTSIKWSPDNIHVATASTHEKNGAFIRIWNSETETLIAKLETDAGREFSWSYDGKKIAFAYENRVRIAYLDEIFQQEHDRELVLQSNKH